MTAEVEQNARDAVAQLLGLTFQVGKPSLGTGEKVDGWIKLTDDRWIILEVEDGQQHPTTNVLKLWQFLDREPEMSIILIHIYFNNSRAVNNSRGKLATWVGKKMETILPGRFYYRRVILNREFSEWKGDQELKEAVSIFQV
jgi:hypothetical protein